ncbi:hypothetical protein [Streptomyces sp. NPDC051014]|uniref:hypothetical protein n=1 Tax=Streptomyces sp. NPDC051014 TaxID=3155751 RepID=UPI0033C676D1
MSINGTSSKKTAAKKTTATPTAARKAVAKKTAAPPAKKAVPQSRNKAVHPAPEPVPADETATAAADEKTVIANFLADRRRRRQLQALKITCYVMATGALTGIGLTIWQLKNSSPMASAYAALAGVLVTATGVSCTVYHFMRRRKNDQDE